MADFVLGMDAGLYQGANGDRDPTAMSEVDLAMDVTVNMEAGEADITTRGNDGWRATVATLREASIDFSMLWQPGDSVFEAIKDAFLASDPLAFAVLDQLVSVSGAQGILGDFSITSFTRNEPLEEAETVDVTITLAEFGEWYEAP